MTRGVFSRHEEGISAACDLLNPPPAVPTPGSTDRKAFLKRESMLTHSFYTVELFDGLRKSDFG